MFKYAFHRRTFVAVFLALLGCRKAPGTTGDFARFFITEITERGGRIPAAVTPPVIEARWTVERDKFGFQVHLFDTEFTRVDAFLVQALGRPLLPTVKNLDGDLHTVYDSKISGFAVQSIAKTSEIYIVAVGPKTAESGQTPADPEPPNE